MLTLWDLNSIVLHHGTRFFQAAAVAILGWTDRDQELLQSLATLSGNMLWASSSFAAESVDEEKAMAYTGAFIGSVANSAVQAGGDRRARALEIVAGLERQLLDNQDRILEALWRRLEADNLRGASPAAVNAAVWTYLFPSYPYPCSHGELQRQIQARLVSRG